MNPKAKIKISREDLINKVRRQREEAIRANKEAHAEYERELKDYVKKRGEFFREVIDYLQTEPDRVIVDKTYSGMQEIRIARSALKTKPPERPSKPKSEEDVAWKYDRSIEQLEMGVDSSISLTVDDYNRFLSGA